MSENVLSDGQTIYWYDQYCENSHQHGLKAYTVDSVVSDPDQVDADVYAVYAANQLCVGPTTAVVLAKLVAPDPDYPDLGPDLIPGASTDHPFVTMNHYGRGTAWYVANSAGYTASKTRYYRTMDLLSSLIDRTAVSGWMTVDAPSTVDVSVEQDRAGTIRSPRQQDGAVLPASEREIIRSIDRTIPVADIHLSFQGQSTAKYISPAGCELAITQTNDRMECLIPGATTA